MTPSTAKIKTSTLVMDSGPGKIIVSFHTRGFDRLRDSDHASGTLRCTAKSTTTLPASVFSSNLTVDRPETTHLGSYALVP
jgi:hypothetical protein